MSKIDINELEKSENKIRDSFSDIEKAINEYFHDFGDGNGMMFEYEFVKYQDRLKNISDEFEKIMKRVHNRIEINNEQPKEEDKTESLLKKRFLKKK